MVNKYELLFVYGTLLETSIQKSIIGRVVIGIVDRIDGYKVIVKKFTDGYFPALIPCAGSTVSGMILELSQRELFKCDKYEGSGYIRAKMTISSGIEVWVYLPLSA